MSNLYLEHHGIKGMKWGVRRYQNPDGSLTATGKARVKKQESKIKARSKKMGDSGHKYLAQKHEYRDLKKLYDKYGINKDFEDKHTVNLSYTRGKITFEAKMVKYKDVIVKDKGGRTVEMLSNGKKEVFKVDDGEFIALRIADLYGDKAMNEFYDSYKKKG